MIFATLRLTPRSLPSAYSATFRQFSRSSIKLQKDAKPRIYRYVVDVHGQLFLHDTVPKNLTSCFKSSQFLDFFFKKLKSNGSISDPTSNEPFSISSNISQTLAEADPAKVQLEDAESENDWEIELSQSKLKTIQELAFQKGYRWISPCMGELNFVKSIDAPIVFRELTENGMLKWAGTFEMEFQPEKLFVCEKTGYLYHPAPSGPSQRRTTKSSNTGKQAENSDLSSKEGSRMEAKTSSSSDWELNSTGPYGTYSLLSSALVLTTLSDGLDLRSDGRGGSFSWKDQRYEIGVIDREKERLMG